MDRKKNAMVEEVRIRERKSRKHRKTSGISSSDFLDEWVEKECEFDLNSSELQKENLLHFIDN